MKDSGEWLGTTDAAEYLGIVPRTLYRIIDKGGIPAYKLGRVIRLRRSDLEAFLAAHRLAPGSISNLYPPPRGGQEIDEDEEE